MPKKSGFTKKEQDDFISEDSLIEHENLQTGLFSDEDELPWTNEWSEEGRDLDDLDSAMELSAIVSDYSIDEEQDSSDTVLEISIASKKTTANNKKEEEELQKTPLADSPDTDFSNGKKFKLPCSNKQLEKMMRDVGIDGINEDAVKVKITNALCPSLCGMEVDNPNFRELNFLAKRLKKMSTEDLKLFNKVISFERQLNPDITPAEVINLSYNLDNYRVYDVSGAKTVEERFQKLGAQLTSRFKGESDENFGERIKVNGESFANPKAGSEPTGAFTQNDFVSRIGENKAIYQSADDIDKLSGLVATIKNNLKF